MKTRRYYYLISSLLILCHLILIKTGGIFDYSHLEGSGLSILAGKMTSKMGILPYAYNKLKICSSKKIIKTEDTIGEILTGEELYTTGYITNINKNKYCDSLCYNFFDNETIRTVKKSILLKYVTNWYLDKLPAGLMTYNKQTNKTFINYFDGIPLGYKENYTYYIYNHLQFHITLNKISENKFDVVGFSILPISISHESNKTNCSKQAENNLEVNFKNKPQVLKEGEILFTYDTVYEYSNITMASRWDHYKPSDRKIHWATIIISNIIIMIFTLAIIYIFSRNVKKDIDNYNNQVIKIDTIYDYGWKQVTGDVFRAPSFNRDLLSAIIGTGVQIFFMFSIALLLGMFGYMNPEKRTNILNLGLTLYCFMGLPGGFFSSAIYRILGGVNWLKNALLTSVLFPGTVLFGFIIVNIILTKEKSTAAVGISDIATLFVLWLFCTSPLILIGSFLGNKTKRIILPCKVNPIPTMIPPKPWFLRYRFISLLGGLISFITIFVELSYVMASLWGHQVYFLVPFLWMSFNLLIIVSGEITILVVFWNLCVGDYRWWWKSFIIGGSPVIYFVIYSIYYFFYLKISTFSAMVVYFGIMALISTMALFICGSTSVLITLGFLIKIYSSIKID